MREIHQHRNTTQLIAHLLILLAQQLHIRQISGIKRSEHALAGDFIETDRRNADGLALKILTGHITIASIAIQCDRNQIIIGVIANKINHYNRIFTACLT